MVNDILISANIIASTPIPKNNKLKKRLSPPVISFKVSVTSAGFFGIGVLAIIFALIRISAVITILKSK